MRVLITGAGVAGLACAVALRRAGINDLTIVERSTEVAAQRGTGIAIPPNGTRALAAVGLPVERLIARGRRLRKYRLLDASGRELSCADLTRLWLGEQLPYFAVHRRMIYEALLEALGEQRIEFSSKADVEPEALAGDQPVLARINGPNGSRAESFDIVVGADGIRSALRQTMWPHIAPRPAVATLGDRLHDDPHVDGDDVADLAIGDEIAGVHDSRITLRLEADEGR